MIDLVSRFSFGESHVLRIKFNYNNTAGSVIDLMNEHISSGFTEKLVLKIFCDTCEAISVLHYNEPPVLHRDLKVC